MVKLLFLVSLSILLTASWAFQSDELLADDEDFGLEGAPRSLDVDPGFSNPAAQPARKNFKEPVQGSESADSKTIQFTLEHAFGDSDFLPAGTFTARLRNSPHGGQTLGKLRFSRNELTESAKENFKRLLEADDFYRIRVPSNVLSPLGKAYVISSVRARCLARDQLEEHFVIHLDGVNVLAVTYGSPGACQFPRTLKYPKKWSFNSNTFLKTSEQAPRTPVFSEDTIVGENGEGEGVIPPERSFWAKYWMYMIPLGLVVMNAITQAMNMAEEPQAGGPAGGPSGGPVQQSLGGNSRSQAAATVRRR